ncbi:MAG: hypothetical protein MUD06_15470 [Rhodospirillales bacterium]|jgi:hypothetical protein|nr:hypothetical protein [Rhodospirillales bacterium]
MLNDLTIRKLKPSGTQLEIADGSDVKGLSASFPTKRRSPRLVGAPAT